MIKAEYLRFVQTLNTPKISEDVRKIANIILKYLDELIPLTSHQGQRVKKIVVLAQKNWKTIQMDIQADSVNDNTQAVKISRLKSMSVGPFRGFARQEEFDLASRLVLIYGPNGTGKSSFCEALEYCLLGNVIDAENKRFRNQSEYLKNAYTNKFIAPNITAEDEQGNEIKVASNEQLYRFCFVEKNRIENFSRIAAQSPAKQTELISTLFGLESFTEFVRNFTAEIDGKYIDLVGKEAEKLTQKRQELLGTERQIQTNKNELQQIEIAEQRLAKQFREGISFNQMVVELEGSEESPGVIQQIEEEIQQPVPTKSNITKTTVVDPLNDRITSDITELEAKQQELTEDSQKLSFKQLYEAISQVQQSSPEGCPACKTPLNQVTVNPYINAKIELSKLQHLALIQQTVEQLKQNVEQSLFKLLQIISTCILYYPKNNPLQPYVLDNSTQPNILWWNSLHQPLPDGLTPLQHLATQVLQLEIKDQEIDKAEQIRKDKQHKLNQLREISRQITILKTRRQTSVDAITSAQQLVKNFEIENAQLIANVDAEKIMIIDNQAISSAYTLFVDKLNEYCNKLPEKLVADLGEKVTKIYNAFNRNDSTNELLAHVKLPLTQNQRLEIAFQNAPTKFYDALHILSEGHIRCLGLAILLSKNLKENAPILIFDDPVNAIDDEHRESIRRTLFEDSYFAAKQVILTCHGEEFFKDICNQLPAQTVNQSKLLTFLPRKDESHIRVDFNCSPRNYIIAARTHINRNEVRDALSKSRQALESLTKEKIWEYVIKHGDGKLSLKLRSAKAPIELRNLTEQLKSKIDKENFGDLKKADILSLLNTLLGINGESREWRYLNKGTHDEKDRAEFDTHTVETIVSTLEQLDAFLTS
ncbi:AAA family ATPase [Legionella pneumophila serogroup 1]